MSRTSLIGAFGMARQSAKDNVPSSFTYAPATSVSLNPNQNVATLPPEIGGSYFLRGSYKASVIGGGDTALIIRPNSVGNLFMAYSGVDNVTPVSGQTGAYSHVFTPFAPAAGVDLPWYTLQKDIARLSAEQYLNAKLQSLRIDIPKSAIATAQASWIATTPSGITSVGSVTTDSTPQMQTSLASVSLTPEGNGSNISANSVKMERFSLTMSNNLSQDEFSVGNLYLDDITLLQKTINVDMDVIIRDTALYQAVYLNGGTIPGSISPSVYRGSLTLTLNSTTNIPTTTQPYQLTFNFPGLDFLTMPISLSGADLVRATLSTQVTLGPSGSDMYTITLINGVASY